MQKTLKSKKILRKKVRKSNKNRIKKMNGGMNMVSIKIEYDPENTDNYIEYKDIDTSQTVFYLKSMFLYDARHSQHSPSYIKNPQFGINSFSLIKKKSGEEITDDGLTLNEVHINKKNNVLILHHKFNLMSNEFTAGVH
jgi:hypothetical protein